MDYKFYKDGKWNNNVLENLLNRGSKISVEEAAEELRMKANTMLVRDHDLFEAKLKMFKAEFENKLAEVHKKVCTIVNNNEAIEPYLKHKLATDDKKVFNHFLPSSSVAREGDIKYHEYIPDGDFWNLPLVEDDYSITEALNSRLSISSDIFNGDHDFRSDILIGVDKENHFTAKTRLVSGESFLPEEVRKSLFKDIEDDRELEILYRELTMFYDDFYKYTMKEFSKAEDEKLKKLFRPKILLENGNYIEFFMETDYRDTPYREEHTGFKSELGDRIRFSDYEYFQNTSPKVEVFYDYVPDYKLTGLEDLFIPDTNIGIRVYNEKLEKIDAFTFGSQTYIKDSDKEVSSLDVRKPLLKYKFDKNLLAVFNDEKLENNNSVEAIQRIVDKLEQERQERERLQVQRELYEDKINKSKEVAEKAEQENMQSRNQIAQSIDKLNKTAAKIEKMEIKPEVLFYYNDDKCCYEIYPEYRDSLKYFDLSTIDFSNVNVKGINFKDCNLVFFDPQKVYKKDLSGTDFSMDLEEVASFDSNMYYVPNSSWDLTDVNLCHANLDYPETADGVGMVLMPTNVDKAIVDEATVLPHTLQEKLKQNKGQSSRKDKILQALKENLEVGDINPEDLTDLISKINNKNDKTGGGNTL